MCFHEPQQDDTHKNLIESGNTYKNNYHGKFITQENQDVNCLVFDFQV